MPNKHYIPIPVFDSLENVLIQYKAIHGDKNPHLIITQWLNQCFANLKVGIPKFAIKDYQMALNFFYSYRGSTDTFKAYRRDLELLL